MNEFHLLILAILAVPVFLVWHFLIRPQKEAAKRQGQNKPKESGNDAARF